MDKKGTDKQYVADSLLHSTTCHYQASVIFFTFLGTVPVPVQLGKIASVFPTIWEKSVVFP